MSTKISWVQNLDGSQGETWNPVIGCSHCSPGCDHCWAERMARRQVAMGTRGHADVVGPDGKWNGRTVFIDSELNRPLHWRKPRTIFVVSMGDLFHPSVPFDVIDRVYAVMALCPQHRFMCLTKRPERMAEYMDYIQKAKRGWWWGECGYLADIAVCSTIVTEDELRARYSRARRMFKPELPDEPTNLGQSSLYHPGWPLPNVYHGVTICNQAEADAKLPVMLQIPGKLWVSYEPALGPVDFTPWLPALSYVVAGGETGPGARPTHPQCFRDVRDQCEAAGVKFHFKSWGEWAPSSAPCVRGQYTGAGVFLRPVGILGNQGDWWDGNAAAMERVGHKAAGNVLDGRTHQEEAGG